METSGREEVSDGSSTIAALKTTEIERSDAWTVAETSGDLDVIVRAAAPKVVYETTVSDFMPLKTEPESTACKQLSVMSM